jgi:hypothetical protein
MLVKPANWDSKFNNWVKDVLSGELIYEDCLDAAISMINLTYDLGGNFPSSFDNLIRINNGRKSDADEGDKEMRGQYVTSEAKIYETLNSICSEQSPRNMLCPAAGWIGLALEDQGTVYIGIDNAKYFCIRPDAVHVLSANPTKNFLGWWKY